MGRETDLNGVSSTNIIVPPGATMAVLINQIAGEISSGIKYFSGGSLEIFNCPVGSSLTNAQLVARQGHGYLFGTAEALNFDGAVRYYLMATGSTVVAFSLKGLSTGF